MYIPSASFPSRKLFWKPYPATSASCLLTCHMITTSLVPGWDRSWVSHPAVSAWTLCLRYWDICPDPQLIYVDLLVQLSWKCSLSWSRPSLILCRLVGFSDLQFTRAELPGSLPTVGVLLLPPVLNQPHFLSTHSLPSLFCSGRPYL